jgi:hypothetical protein
MKHGMVAAAGVMTMLALAGCGSPEEAAIGSDRPGAAAGPENDAAGAGGAAARDGGLITQAVQDASGQDIVYTVELSIEVEDVHAASDRAATIATAAGGVVASEQVSGAEYATVTLRIPADVHADAVTGLESLGTVIERNRRTENVHEEVVDTASRVASQQASIARIRALLAEATDLAEIISIESELASREADLDALLSRQQQLARLTSMATVTVSLHAPGDEPETEDDMGFLAGLSGGWGALVATAAVVLTATGAMLPFAAAAALVGAPVWLVIRRRRAARATPAGPGEPPAQPDASPAA